MCKNHSKETCKTNKESMSLRAESKKNKGHHPKSTYDKQHECNW